MMYSLLKETKTCQVCKKSFSNGKALGGHMRSHTRRLSAESSSSSTTPSLRQCNSLGANFKPHETVLMRSVHTSEAVGGPMPDLNKEPEQQSTAAERKIVVDLEEVNSIESLCGITIEQSALCLLQMSEDKRTETLQKLKEVYHLILARKRKETENYIEIHSDQEDDDEDDDKFVDEDEDSEDEDVTFHTSDVVNLTQDSDEDDDDDADENAYFGGREKKCKKQSKYVCDICGKVLRSYQALGGHRTSHRNKRLKIAADKNQSAKAENGPLVRRHYECEFCNRVFESGQALGGHKKIHYAFLQPSNSSTSTKWP